MRALRSFGIVVLCVLPVLRVLAGDFAPVTIQADTKQAWVGQRVVFYVALRSEGPFVGTASFDLPRLDGTVILKIGSPVVSSENVSGTELFVQIHEFALFSQGAGKLTLPECAVRFSAKDGHTGPETEIHGSVPAWSVQIERPEGSEGIGFLVTTDSLELSETWEPHPEDATVGDIFKRTINQRADDVVGMALAPVSTAAPEGIRVYLGKAATQDALERGDFTGERQETVTYLLERSGTFTLPALTYVWWNPATKALRAKTLPAVTFEVRAGAAEGAAQKAEGRRHWFGWFLFLICGAVGIWAMRRFIRKGLVAIQSKLNPPKRVAARRLWRACQMHDAHEAFRAWQAWRVLTEGDGRSDLSTDLRDAVQGLSTYLYREESEEIWRGEALSHAFERALQSALKKEVTSSALPKLNP